MMRFELFLGGIMVAPAVVVLVGVNVNVVGVAVPLPPTILKAHYILWKQTGGTSLLRTVRVNRPLHK
jgi:hypothetical protein